MADERKDGTRLDYSQTAAIFPQYAAAIMATFGGFCLGTCFGWSSPVAGQLMNSQYYDFPVTDAEFAWVGSLFPLGCVFATPVVGWMVTVLGRKNTLLILCAPSCAGYALITFAQNVWWFYLGRLLTGVGGGGFTVVVPMYTSEMAQTHIRGTLVAFYQLQLTAGALFSYIVGSIVDVHWFSFTCSIAPIVYSVVLLILPESPIYYVEKEKYKNAKKSLHWFRGKHYDVDGEVQIMQNNIEEANAEKLSFVEAFSTRTAKKGLAITLGLMFFQQFSGVITVVFYTTTIFQAAGSTLDSNIETIIAGTVSSVSTYASTLFVDRLGRRPLLVLSGSTMAVCTLFLGLFFILKDNSVGVESVGWAPLLSVCVFLIAFALGYGPVPWIFMSEIFPRQISGYAVSIVCSFNFLCVFLVSNYFSTLSSLIGRGQTFIAFTTMSVIGTVFVYFLIPETKNKTLEEILKGL